MVFVLEFTPSTLTFTTIEWLTCTLFTVQCSRMQMSLIIFGLLLPFPCTTHTRTYTQLYVCYIEFTLDTHFSSYVNIWRVCVVTRSFFDLIPILLLFHFTFDAFISVRHSRHKPIPRSRMPKTGFMQLFFEHALKTCVVVCSNVRLHIPNRSVSFDSE